MAKAAKKPAGKSVETLRHNEAKRKNIPTAEYQPVLEKEQQAAKKIRYPREHGAGLGRLSHTRARGETGRVAPDPSFREQESGGS